ncbi:hypothetical protein Tco_0569775 [Tanacetum coccineum]
MHPSRCLLLNHTHPLWCWQCDVVESLRWWGDGCDGEADMEVVMAAGGMVLGGGDGCDRDDVVRVGMTMVVDLWCGSGGGWPESGRKKVEWRRKSIRRRGVFFFSVTLIASYLSKSSSTNGDVLEGGGV